MMSRVASELALAGRPEGRKSSRRRFRHRHVDGVEDVPVMNPSTRMRLDCHASRP
jgi:hypothetical protein